MKCLFKLINVYLFIFVLTVAEQEVYMNFMKKNHLFDTSVV